MALPTNTFTTYSAIGNREDLSDVIYNVDPYETPGIVKGERNTANAVLHEWQTDTLAAASSANAVVEGDDATTDAVTVTVRLANTCQIQDKVSRVTGTQQAVVSAGRKDELAYQIYKDTLELRRDMEKTLFLNQAEVTGDSTTARKMGTMGAWIINNDDFGSGGASGTGLGNTARTDGTLEAFTEARLKTVLLACWDAGGNPDCIMLNGFNKQVASGFTGNATRFVDADRRDLLAGIHVYESDFGDLEIIPNRFQRGRDVWVLQSDMYALAYLRPVGIADLAKTGDSERRQLIAEWTLEMRNEKAHGLVADCLFS